MVEMAQNVHSSNPGYLCLDIRGYFSRFEQIWRSDLEARLFVGKKTRYYFKEKSSGETSIKSGIWIASVSPQAVRYALEHSQPVIKKNSRLAFADRYFLDQNVWVYNPKEVFLDHTAHKGIRFVEERTHLYELQGSELHLDLRFHLGGYDIFSLQEDSGLMEYLNAGPAGLDPLLALQASGQLKNSISSRFSSIIESNLSIRGVVETIPGKKDDVAFYLSDVASAEEIFDDCIPIYLSPDIDWRRNYAVAGGSGQNLAYAKLALQISKENQDTEVQRWVHIDRTNISDHFDREISDLLGVGQRREGRFKEAGIATLGDLYLMADRFGTRSESAIEYFRSVLGDAHGAESLYCAILGMDNKNHNATINCEQLRLF